MRINNQWFDQHSDRRDVLRTAGRFGALGVLAGLGLFSAVNHPIQSSEEDCPELSRCKGCGVLKVCSLPQAKSVRKTIQENTDAEA